MEQRELYLVDEAHANDVLYVTFTAEEVGRIAVMAVRGVPRDEAIRSMPRYSHTLHAAYSAFWDDLSAVIQGE